MLEFLLPNFVKVSNTIDNIRLGSNLNFHQIILFTKKSFLNTTFRYVQSQSGPRGDIDWYIQ